MPFKSSRQRKAAFANMNSGGPSNIKFRSIRITKDVKTKDVKKFLGAKNKLVKNLEKVKNQKDLSPRDRIKISKLIRKIEKSDDISDIRRSIIGFGGAAAVFSIAAALPPTVVGIAGVLSGIGLTVGTGVSLIKVAKKLDKIEEAKREKLEAGIREIRKKSKR